MKEQPLMLHTVLILHLAAGLTVHIIRPLTLITPRRACVSLQRHVYLI